MITLSTVQEVLAGTFFDNNMVIAGLMMYMVFIAVAFYVTKNLMAVMLLSIPLTLIFASMGILNGDLLIVMIIVTVVGLALAAGNSLSGKY